MKRRERVAQNVSAVLAVILDQVGGWCHQVERFLIYSLLADQAGGSRQLTMIASMKPSMDLKSNPIRVTSSNSKQRRVGAE